MHICRGCRAVALTHFLLLVPDSCLHFDKGKLGGLAVSPGKPRVPHCEERPGAAHSRRDPACVVGWR